eukprot:m.28518 g.28518  ORF g.28518 m.28518 type:complete len:341 (+) comp4562_c0_seq1:1312-2334(+)
MDMPRRRRPLYMPSAWTIVTSRLPDTLAAGGAAWIVARPFFSSSSVTLKRLSPCSSRLIFCCISSTWMRASPTTFLSTLRLASSVCSSRFAVSCAELSSLMRCCWAARRSARVIGAPICSSLCSERLQRRISIFKNSILPRASAAMSSACRRRVLSTRSLPRNTLSRFSAPSKTFCSMVSCFSSWRRGRRRIWARLSERADAVPSRGGSGQSAWSSRWSWRRLLSAWSSNSAARRLEARSTAARFKFSAPVMIRSSFWMFASRTWRREPRKGESKSGEVMLRRRVSASRSVGRHVAELALGRGVLTLASGEGEIGPEASSTESASWDMRRFGNDRGINSP